MDDRHLTTWQLSLNLNLQPSSLLSLPTVTLMVVNSSYNSSMFFFFFFFFFYIKRVLAKGEKLSIKKIPLVARPCKEDRRNKNGGQFNLV